MSLAIHRDTVRFARQFFSLFVLSFILFYIVFPRWGDGTFLPTMSAAFLFSMIIYPPLFLVSWVKKPPQSKWVEVLLHLMTVPVILYFLLISLFFVQYAVASFSPDALLMALSMTLVTVFVIFQYVQLVKRQGY